MIDNATFVILNYSHNEFNKLIERVEKNCPFDDETRWVDFKLENLRVRYFP
jgi:uncharacterized protein YdcH (DUF465 family)